MKILKLMDITASVHACFASVIKNGSVNFSALRAPINQQICIYNLDYCLAAHTY